MAGVTIYHLWWLLTCPKAVCHEAVDKLSTSCRLFVSFTQGEAVIGLGCDEVQALARSS